VLSLAISSEIWGYSISISSNSCLWISRARVSVWAVQVSKSFAVQQKRAHPEAVARFEMAHVHVVSGRDNPAFDADVHGIGIGVFIEQNLTGQKMPLPGNFTDGGQFIYGQDV
jgi:hypothetical protein